MCRDRSTTSAARGCRPVPLAFPACVPPAALVAVACRRVPSRRRPAQRACPRAGSGRRATSWIGRSVPCTTGRYRRAMEDTRPKQMSCYIIIYNTPHSAALYSTAPHNPDLCPYSTPLFVLCVLSGWCKCISTSIRSISISIRTGCISLHTVLRRGGGCSLTRREGVVKLSDARQT